MTRSPNEYAGGHRSRVTPVPIPNTEVKPATADGTVWETVWESRSLPALFLHACELRLCGRSFVRRPRVTAIQFPIQPASFGSRLFCVRLPVAVRSREACHHAGMSVDLAAL